MSIVTDPSVARIQAMVASRFHIPLREMKSARRYREVARPRQVAMYLARRLTMHSLPEIGRYFGGRDHTTVMHGIRRIEDLLATDRLLKRKVTALVKELGE